MSTSRTLLVAFVILATAFTGAGVIPEPWSNVLTSIVGSLYTWGLVKAPRKVTPKPLAPKDLRPGFGERP